MKDQKIILSYEENQKGNHYHYIHLRENLKDLRIGQSVKQVSYDGFASEEAQNEKIELVIDFDENDKIVGIEIISNRDIIPKELEKY